MDAVGGRFIVTGGGGFVGGAIARALRERGAEVVSIARGEYPELRTAGIESVRGDLGEAGPWMDSFAGAVGVFHVAAKVDMWGARADFFRANVLGTRNVMAACRRHGVQRLVFTSSPSVIADGRDLPGIDESYPYPDHYEALYPETKAAAEREVLAAKDLWSVALRPHLIWGPGDTNLLPTIIERARSGRLVQVGHGENLVDTTFIDDCVAAHLAAFEALGRNPACRGRAYFISQGEPISLWGWVNQILAAVGMPPVTRRINPRVARGIAALCELWARLRGGAEEPLLTRFLVAEMATSHYFDISAARRDLGFVPRWSIAAAMERTFSAERD